MKARKVLLLLVGLILLLYIIISLHISFYVNHLIRSNFGKSQHNYVDDIALNQYLTSIFDHSTQPAPIGEGKTYYVYKMSFPLTKHTFTEAICQYKYTYSLFEQLPDGTEKKVQGCIDNLVTIYLKFRNGRWEIINATVPA